MSAIVETPVTPLPDLSALVAAQFSALAASGAIEKMIETQLVKAVQSALEDQMRSYSDFGKAINERVKEALNVADLQKLPNYGEFIGSILEKNVNHQLHGAYAKKLESDIKALFVDAPESITLSELIDAFKKHVCDDVYRDHDNKMTLHVEEKSYGSQYVRMDRASDQKKYQCAITMLIQEDGTVAILKIDDQEVGKDLFIGSLDAFERLLMRIYVMGSKIVIDGGDAHDFDLEYDGYAD